MKAAFFPTRFSSAFCVVLLAGAVQTACAQTSDFVLQTFDSGICGWSTIFNSPVTLAFDPTQDDTGNGGGSCHVSFNLSQDGIFVVNASFESCCFCDSEVLLVLTNFASVDFDVKWDNTSTFTPAQFNSNPSMGSPGIAIGAMNGNNGYSYNGGPTICYSNVYIPSSATSGWVHVSEAINPASSYSTIANLGLYLFESFPASGSGTAAFWLDNVKLKGLKPPQFIPAMSSLNSNHFTLQWTANPGCTCTVLKSTDLVHWSTLVTGYPAGGLTTGTISYTDTVATASHSFYLITTP
jgi:hypothetical protein